MDKIEIVAGLILLALAISWIIRKVVINRLLKQLYDAAYVQKDRETFMLLISSLQSQMTISEVSRNIMTLNAAIAWDDLETVKTTAGKLISTHLKDAEARTVYGRTIGYLCEKRDSQAIMFLEKMQEYFKGNNDMNIILMLYDIQLVYDIYIEKKAERRTDLIELAESAQEDNAKAVYQYRLAVLDHSLGNKEESRKELKKALENTDNARDRRKIERILEGEWDLL